MNALITHSAIIESVEDEIKDGVFPLERAIASYVHQLRSKCQQNEKITHLKFECEADGPVHHGEMKITFSVSFQSYGGEVKSHTISVAFAELLRRHGFDEKNNGLVLTQLGDVART